MTLGRKIDFGFLAREGFEIGDLLRFQGWEYMCTLDLPTYPRLVREFYANAKPDSKPFTTVVRGVPIKIDENVLGRLLKAPNSGNEFLTDKTLGFRLLFRRDDIVPFEELLAKELTPEHRLLHHIVARIFLPRTGRFDFVSLRDMTLLYHILVKDKFNFPMTMYRIILETVHRTKTALPYGMFLTLVFRDFGVALDGEPFDKLKHFDTYNANSLKRMKFRKLSDGTWTKVDDGEAPQPVPPRAPRSRSRPSSSRPSSSFDPSVPSTDAPPSSPTYVPPSDSTIPSSSCVRLDPVQFEELVQRVSTTVTAHVEEIVMRASERITAHIDDVLRRALQVSQPPSTFVAPAASADPVPDSDPVPVPDPDPAPASEEPQDAP